AASFAKAVVVGSREDLDEDTRTAFVRTGTAHILAVSGFNVAIVALVISQLLRLIGIGKRHTRIPITMLAILAYALIVGLQPSVVRALIMVEVVLFATLIERIRNPLNIVSSAALINLMLRPFDLFDAGFQL